MADLRLLIGIGEEPASNFPFRSDKVVTIHLLLLVKFTHLVRCGL